MTIRVSRPILVVIVAVVVSVASVAAWMMSPVPAEPVMPALPELAELMPPAAENAETAETAEASASASAAAAAAAAVEAAPAGIRTVALVDGRASGAENTLKFRRGERVELRFETDRPIVLHLHGYDIEVSGAPQQPAVMAFDANLPGRFPVSEHGKGRHHHRALLFVEVHP